MFARRTQQATRQHPLVSWPETRRAVRNRALTRTLLGPLRPLLAAVPFERAPVEAATPSYGSNWRTRRRGSTVRRRVQSTASAPATRGTSRRAPAPKTSSQPKRSKDKEPTNLGVSFSKSGELAPAAIPLDGNFVLMKQSAHSLTASTP